MPREFFLRVAFKLGSERNPQAEARAPKLECERAVCTYDAGSLLSHLP